MSDFAQWLVLQPAVGIQQMLRLTCQPQTSCVALPAVQPIRKWLLGDAVAESDVLEAMSRHAGSPLGIPY